MDLSSIDFNINIVLLSALIGIMEAIKKQDPNNKLKKWYWIIYLFISSLSGVGLSFIDAKTMDVAIIAQSIIYGIEYFGIGSLCYQFIIKMAKKIMDNFSDKYGGEGEIK